MEHGLLVSFVIVLTATTCYIWDTVQAHDIPDAQQYCRYVFYMKKRTWGAANEICSLQNRTLAKIAADPELSSLATMALSTVQPIVDRAATIVLSNDFWIGLHAYSSQADFTHFWADCDGLNTAGFNPWADADQSTSVGCAAMNPTDEKFRISDCNQEKQFICEDISTGNALCWDQKGVNDDEHSWLSVSAYYTDPVTSECALRCDSTCAGIYVEGTNCHVLVYNKVDGFHPRESFYIKNFISYRAYADMSASVPPQVMCSDQFSQISSPMETSSFFDITSTYVEVDSSTPILSSIPDSISTTAVSTQYFTTGGVTTSQCYCPCAQYNNITYTPEELHKKLEEMKKELTINVKETNTYKRTLISAPDNRVSAKSIGYFGAVILALVGGTLLLMDIPTLVKDTKSFFTNLSSCCKM